MVMYKKIQHPSTKRERTTQNKSLTKRTTQLKIPCKTSKVTCEMHKTNVKQARQEERSLW